jgi:lipid-A-disaccharide synthase-like uncharacterized protein
MRKREREIMKEKLDGGYYIAIGLVILCAAALVLAKYRLLEVITSVSVFGFKITDLFNIGTFGSFIFFISWLVQTYESKKAEKSIVSTKFWALRIIGLVFVGIYSYQIHNLLFILMNVVGIALSCYNIYLLKKRKT